MNPILIGMKAFLSDGACCTVVDVLIDPQTGEEHYLVLDAHGCFGADVAVPLARVWRVDRGVHLTLTRPDLGRLLRATEVVGTGPTPLRSCSAVRHGAHWPYRAGRHYPHAG